MSHEQQPSLDAIHAALDKVYDPELDDSILRLGFVDAIELDGDAVTVRFKLPTFWCAPNFAFMMAYDIRQEVAAVAGVRAVNVQLRNNCAEQEITAGVNAGHSFEETFGDDASGEGLEELRQTFARKGFLARQDVLLRRLRQVGFSDTAILDLRVGDLVADGEDVLVGQGESAVRVRLAAGDLAKYLHKRAKLNMPQGDDVVLFTTLDGQTLHSVDLVDYLRRSRGARLNIAFNSSLCEGLLRATYTPERVGDTSSVGDVLLTTMP